MRPGPLQQTSSHLQEAGPRARAALVAEEGPSKVHSWDWAGRTPTFRLDAHMARCQPRFSTCTFYSVGESLHGPVGAPKTTQPPSSRRLSGTELLSETQ